MVSNRDQALAALREIAVQGEGLPPGQPAEGGSHFERFRSIYQQFPGGGQWLPSRRVPTNPLLPTPGTLPTADTITHVHTQRWARLSNCRYEILLGALSPDFSSL